MFQLLEISDQKEYEDTLDSDDFDFRYQCGLVLPGRSYSIITKDEFINSLVTHYVVVSINL